MQTHTLNKTQRKLLLASNAINASKQKQTVFWSDFKMDWVKKESMCGPYGRFFMSILVMRNHNLKLITENVLLCTEIRLFNVNKAPKGNSEDFSGRKP